MAEAEIRRACREDMAEITAIYNHYVRETSITFDIEPWTVEQRRPWLAQFGETGRHQLLVAELDGQVVGYAGSTRFRVKAAYDPSVETTIYLAPDRHGQRLGRRLYGQLLQRLEREDVHRVYGGITLPNPASIALHQAFDFRSIGVFQQVGRKFGRYWDVKWLEKELP